MYGMFSECFGLTSLDVSNFDTTNVIDMYGMFNGCSGLTELDVSNFDTTKVISSYNINNMFGDCTNLTSIITPKVFSTAAENYFKTRCSGWYDIDNNQLTDSSEIYKVMLYRSDTKTPISLTNKWNSETNSCYWKLNKTTLTIYSTNNHNLGSNASDLTEQTDIKNNKTNITKVSIRGSTVFEVSTDLTSLFNGFSSCTSIEGLSYFNLTNVNNLTSMFSGCGKLHSLNLSSWDLKNKTTTDMLNGLTSLYYIITPETFDDSFQSELYDNPNFTNLNYRGVKLKSSIEIEPQKLYFTQTLRWSYGLDDSCYWFYSNDNVLTITSDETNNKANDASELRNQFTIEGIELIKLSEVKGVVIEGSISFVEGTNLSNLFSGFSDCESFNGLENLDVSEVTDMDRMFYSCKALKHIKLGNITINNYIKLN